MQLVYTLEKSSIDARFFEVKQKDEVIQEVEVSFHLIKIPSAFQSVDAIFTWLANQEKTLAKRYVYYLLSMKNYSRCTLLKKMQQKGYSVAVCKVLLDEIEKQGFLSETDFFQSFIQKMVKKGYGPRLILKKMQEEGGDEIQFRLFFDEKLKKEALSCALSKLKGKSEKQKSMALARRGFEWADCFKS